MENLRAYIEAGLQDPQIRGLYRDEKGAWRFDFRYTENAVAESPVLSPRTADLNMSTPEAAAVPPELITELGLDN